MVKKTFFCNSYDLGTVEKYLEEMAQKGYMFVKRNGAKYFFEPCEPKQLKFYLDAFEKASIFDTKPEPLTEEYIEFCKECGWTHCCTDGKIQVFYTEDMNAIPIRTDGAERLKNIHNNAMKHEGVLWLSYSFVFIMHTIVSLTTSNLVEALIENFTMLCAGMIYFLYVLIDAIQYGVFYFKNRKNVKNGEELYFYKRKTAAINVVLKMSLFIIGLLVLSGLIAMSESVLMAILLVMIGGVVWAIYIIEKIRDGSGSNDRNVNIAFSGIIMVVVFAAVFYIPIIGIILESFFGPEPELLVSYNEVGIEIDNIDRVNRDKSKDISAFGCIDSGWEVVLDKNDIVLFSIDYAVIETDYEAIKESYIDDKLEKGLKDVSKDYADLWQAEKVYYQLDTEDYISEEWIVEYKDCIVKFEVGKMKLTDEMVKNISEKFVKNRNTKKRID